MNSSLFALLKTAQESLMDAEISEPEISAKFLLAGVIGIEPKELIFYDKDVSDEQRLIFEEYIKERLTGRPVAYILGKQNFRGLDFFVNESVLIPRPETEELVDLALEYQDHGTIAIDLGTGSGNIPICLQKEGTWKKVYGLEISKDALKMAESNATNLDTVVTFKECDVTSREFKILLEDIVSNYQPSSLCITANLPYISSQERDELEKDVRDFEPHIALFGGEIGDEMILSTTKTIWDVCSSHSLPFFMIHELDDQMSLRVKEKVEAITGSTWQVRKDIQSKSRFLVFNTIVH